MIRWLSWAKSNFVSACDKVHFERITRRRYSLGPTRDDVVAEGLAEFAVAATLLEEVLSGRGWLVGSSVSYADFRMATVLPFADLAGLDAVALGRHLVEELRLQEMHLAQIGLVRVLGDAAAVLHLLAHMGVARDTLAHHQPDLEGRLLREMVTAIKGDGDHLAHGSALLRLAAMDLGGE